MMRARRGPNVGRRGKRTGRGGGTTALQYITLPGASGKYISTPDAAALRIVGDLELVVRVAPTSWATLNQDLVAKFNGTPNRAYKLRMNASTGGRLEFLWSANGTAALAAASTAAVPFADGSPGWIKATFDVDNGASGRTVKFWTAADQVAEPVGGQWTQLGSSVTTATVTSIVAGTNPLELGGDSAGTSELFAGKFYRAIVRSGIDGTVVADFDASRFVPATALTYTDAVGSNGGVWTRQGGV